MIGRYGAIVAEAEAGARPIDVHAGGQLVGRLGGRAPRERHLAAGGRGDAFAAALARVVRNDELGLKGRSIPDRSSDHRLGGLERGR